MNMNTDTPRTDDQSVRYYDDATGTRIKYVAAKFACQLERELAQRERERDEAREQLAAERELADRLALALKMTRWDSPVTCKKALTAWKEARSES